MTSAVCFLVFAAVLADAVLRKREILTPFRIYLCFHSLTYGIACLALHRAMTPFLVWTQIIYYGSGAAFLAGCLVPGWVDGAGEPRQRKTAPVLDTADYDWNLHFWCSVFVALLYFSGIIMATVGVGGMPVFMKNVHDAIFKFMSYSAISGLLIGGCGLALGMLFMCAVSGRHRILGINVSWFLLGAIAVVHAMTFSRSSFIFFIFFALVYYNFAVRKLPLTKLGAALLIAFAGFAGIAYVKTMDMVRKYHLQEMGIKSSTLTKLIVGMPYIYVANNFWNLDWGINEENWQVKHNPTYGTTTLSGVTDGIWLGNFLGAEIRESYGYEDIFHKQTQKVKGLNTVGYQWGLYKDFGAPGTIIVPFLAGIVFGLLYLRMRQAPSLPLIAAYAYLAYFNGFSWFLAFWESQVYVYPFLFLVGVAFWCRASHRSRRAQAAGGGEDEVATGALPMPGPS